MPRTVLVIDDEKDLAGMIGDYLEALGFRVVAVYNGREGLEAFDRESPDLVLCDVMMPGIDGFEFVRQLRAREGGQTIPVMMLTARSGEADRVLGLELGADDYLVKPFSMKEMAARIRALLRRVYDREEESEKLVYDTLTLDSATRQLQAGERKIDLTAAQYRILLKMFRQPGRVFTRMDLLRAFQNDPWEGYERTIDAHIKNLRKLLGDDPVNPRWLVTVWGQGYKLGSG
jgi:DNA-binding response OmpR family regulator